MSEPGIRVIEPQKPRGLSCVLQALQRRLRKKRSRPTPPLPRSDAKQLHSRRLEIEEAPLEQRSKERDRILERIQGEDSNRAFGEIARFDRGLNRTQYNHRLLRGLDALARYRTRKNDPLARSRWLLEDYLKSGLSLEDLVLAYSLGLLREMKKEIPPAEYKALERLILQDAGVSFELTSSQNLRHLLTALNFLILQEIRQTSEKQQARGREKKIRRIIRLINTEIELIFKEKELTGVRIKDKARNKSFKIQALIELGRLVEKAERALALGSPAELLNLIMAYQEKLEPKQAEWKAGPKPSNLPQKIALRPSEAIKILIRICRLNPKKSLPFLIKALVQAKLLPTAKAAPKTPKVKTKPKPASRLSRVNRFEVTRQRIVGLIRTMIFEVIKPSENPDLQAEVAPLPRTQRKLTQPRIKTQLPAPEAIEQVINQLVYEYKNKLQASSKEDTAYFQASLEIISELVERTPEYLPALIENYARHHSSTKTHLRLFLSAIGIKAPKDPAADIFEPLIDRVLQTPQGQEHALSSFYEYLSHPEGYSKPPRAQAQALRKIQGPIFQVVQNILSAEIPTPTPTLAAKPRTQALAENIVLIAQANNLSPVELKPQTARTLMHIAVKLEQFAECSKKGRPNEAQILLEELFELQRTSGLVIPVLALLVELSETNNAKGRPLPSTVFQLFIRATEASHGNLALAARVIETLRAAQHSNAPEVKKLGSYLLADKAEKDPAYNPHLQLVRLVVESSEGNIPKALRMLEALRKDQETWSQLIDLASHRALNVFHIQYAYCFLAESFTPKERTLENLRSLLAQDREGKHLFLTLQKIPAAIKGQSPDIYADAFDQITSAQHLAEILVYWNLINTYRLSQRSDRQEIATRILNYLQNNYGESLWENMLKLTERGKFRVVNNFFRHLLLHIAKQAREKAQRDPFQGLKQGELPQIQAAIQHNEGIIQNALN